MYPYGQGRADAARRTVGDVTAAKLIIIRGPSGAGKSTVARALAAASSRPTAVVDRDHYLFLFNAVAPAPDQELLESTIRFCLDRGFDVVFEGNFKAHTHAALLDRLFAAHPRENFVFYLDVSLDETIRRHEGRRQIISVEKMCELYPATTPLGLPGEVLVPETLRADEVVRLIRDTASITATGQDRVGGGEPRS